MEIAIKILEGAIAQRELGNKTVPNHLRLKESLEEIESLTKAVNELKNLHKANVIKSVCDCVDELRTRGIDGNNYCTECHRRCE